VGIEESDMECGHQHNFPLDPRQLGEVESNIERR
jgi:hypothetical protein